MKTFKGSCEAKVILPKDALQKKLEHIQAKKRKFWGKDERIYHFYNAQEILIRDLIAEEQC